MRSPLLHSLALALLATACVSSRGVSDPANPGGGAAEAAANTVVAAGMAGVRRAQGECYTPCTPGNACNPRTGTCDPLPCRGECRADERCDQSGLVPHCVSTTELKVVKPAEPAPAPPSNVPAP